jgi:hypothetical protein
MKLVELEYLATCCTFKTAKGCLVEIAYIDRWGLPEQLATEMSLESDDVQQKNYS